MQVLLGNDRGALHIYSLAKEQLLATKQLTHGAITDIVCCSSNAGSSKSSSSSSSSSRFAVLSQEGMGLWRIRRGLSHGILPGGHKQAVISLQVCQAHVQVRRGAG